MKILIVATNRNAHPVPVLPAGACMVAEAAEQAGYRVTMLDLMFTADPRAAVRSALANDAFDVIGFSVRNIDNIDMRGPRNFITDLVPLIETVRGLTPAPLVLGGSAVTIMPRETMRATGISCAVIGNGEAVFPLLAEKLIAHEPWQGMRGVASLVDGKFRVNPAMTDGSYSCAGPEYGRWLDMKAYRAHLSTIPIQTKQGCSFQCVYCTYRKIEGTGYRLSEAGSVAEIVLRYEASGFCDIEFVDNVFNAPYEHARLVCDSLIRSRHRARLQTVELSPASFDHGLVSAMEHAGFVGIGLTVESASDPVLEGLHKGYTAREVHAAAEAVKRSSIPCLWIFLLGGPGETQETVRETLAFAEKFVRPQDAAFFSPGIRIYPGTELEMIARRQGLLSLPTEDMLSPVFYIAPGLNADWVTNQVKKSMDRYMNFMSGDSMSFSYLPLISRVAHGIGLKPPLWRYTRFIRKGLRSMGMRV